MKKKLALLTSALLVTSFALGATSCASKDVSKIAPQTKTVTTNTTTITALNLKGNVSVKAGTVDKTGLVVTTTANIPAATQENPYPQATSYTHKLFDMKANAYVSGAEEVVNVPNENTATKYEYAMYSDYADGVIQKLNDGLYYTQRKQYTRTKVADVWTNWQGGETTYTLYSRNGVVVSNVKGQPNNGMFTQDDGTRIYVDFKGNVKTEKDPLTPILAWGNNPTEVGEYLFYDGKVFDKEGVWVRNFNASYEFGLAANEEMISSWTVGDKYFVQTITLLPENAKKYDFISTSSIDLSIYLDNTNGNVYGTNEDGAQKYNLTTYRYDADKEKVKEVDFDYVVVDTWNSYKNNEVAILWCQEIVDEQISRTAFVQSFDEKGNVKVDLQKLAPGATDFTYYTDYAVLENGYTGLETVVKEKEVIGTFVADTVEYKNNVAYKDDDNASNLYIYNLDGSLNKSVHYTYYTNLANDNFYYETENGAYVYDTKEKSETLIVSLGNNTTIDTYNRNNAYINVFDKGADGLSNTEDDKESVYFLMGSAAPVTVETAKTSLDVSIIAQYSSTNASGYMVAIKTTSNEQPENESINVTFISVDKAYN